MDRVLIAKYGWNDAIPALANADDPQAVTEVLARIVSEARGMLAKVKAPKPADETVKVDDPFTAKAKKDETAKKTAEEFLRTVAVSILEQFEDSPEVFYHLRHSDVLADVLRDETEYQSYASLRGMPKIQVADTEKGTLADDYRGAKVFVQDVLNLIADPDSLTWPPNTVKKGKKGLEPALEPLKGNYGASDGSTATGRYARSHMVVWNVGAMSYTDPKEALRAIWNGPDRVDHSVKELNDTLDTEWANVMSGKVATFTINGKTVTVSKKEGAEEDSEEEDSE
jgi:hypothetical protein